MERNRAFKIFTSKLLPHVKQSWTRFLVCGSYRRGLPNVRDLDIVVIGDMGATRDIARRIGWTITIGVNGATKTILRITKHNLSIDLLFTRPSCWGAATMHHTGPIGLNIAQRTKAKDLKGTLNQYGFFKDGKRVASRSEHGIYKALHMDYMTPTEREQAAWSR